MTIVAVIMSVSSVACSNDDEDDKQSNTVIGTWQVTSSTYTEEVAGDTYDEEYNDIGDIYTFYSDGTGLLEWIDSSGKNSSIITYKINSDNTIIYIDYEDGDGFEEMRMSITDNALMKWTYTDEEDGKDYTITLKELCQRSRL